MTRKDRTEGIYSRKEVLEYSEREQYYTTQIRELLAYAYRYSDDVKKRFDRSQLHVEKFTSLADMRHIPILKKSELVFLQSMGPRLGGMLTKDLGDLRRVYLSPGPIFVPEDRMDDYWGYTEAFYAAGFRPGDIVQVAFNYHLSPAGLVFEEPLRNLDCAVIPTGQNADIGMQLDVMEKLKVTGIVGPPSYILLLAEKAEGKGISLRKDLALEVAFVTGERFTEKTRELLEKKFEFLMRGAYGTADVGCVAYECYYNTGLHISSRCYVEICNPDTGMPLNEGEVGEVVVTVFSKTYPLIRFATGDLSYIVNSPCPCGRSGPRLGAILGRVDTTARVKGIFVYPYQVEQVIAEFPEIVNWNIEVSVQDGVDEILLSIGVQDEFTRMEELLHVFREKIKIRPTIQVLSVEQINIKGVGIHDTRE